MKDMIKLRKFEAADISRLLGWIPDARFLLQWAGPQYKYPLDVVQLLAAIEKTMGKRPLHYMFAAFHQMTGTVVGHIELMSVDYEKKTALLGRILIGPTEVRGKGWGTAMVAEVLKFGFNILGLTEINLGVFDFNQPAINCYKKLGFTEYEFCENARQFEGQWWNLIMMKLDKKTYLKQRNKQYNDQ